MTAEHEKLAAPIDAYLEASSELRLRMQNRIANASKWDDAHLLELLELSEGLRRMEFELVKMREGTR